MYENKVFMKIDHERGIQSLIISGTEILFKLTVPVNIWKDCFCEIVKVK